MFVIRRKFWALLVIVGIAITATGVAGVILTASAEGVSISGPIIAAGMITVFIASCFIFKEGRKLKKDLKAFRKFDEIRSKAQDTPNDLDKGYLIDYTADPENAIRYTPNEICGEVSDTDSIEKT